MTSRVAALAGIASLVLLALGSPARGDSWPWREQGRIGRASMTSLACPSVSLCVATDAAGNVVVSNAPAASPPRWSVISLDPGQALVSVSCPQPTFCIAIDTHGHAFISSAPTMPHSWTATSAPSDVRDVTCTSASLCLGGGFDVYATTAPAGGAGSWQVVDGEDDGPLCGEADCVPGVNIVSCASSSLCVSGDTYGGADSSTDPTGGQQAWSGRGPQAGDYVGLACPTMSLCVGICPVGDGANGFDCPGGGYGDATIVTWNPSRATPRGVRGSFRDIWPSWPTGLWCASSTACFASDTQGDLLASADPAGAWDVVWSVGQQSPANPVVGVACPSPDRCIAITGSGRLLVGARPPSPAGFRLMLKELLARREVDADLARLERHGRYVIRFASPSAGRLHVAWYARPPHSHRPVLVAAGTIAYTESAAARASVTLTGAGARLVRTNSLFPLIERISFSRSSSPTVSVTRKISVG